MGLFAFPEGYLNATAEAEVDAVILNLKLWKEHRTSRGHYAYLLCFAESGIQNAIKKEMDDQVESG